jgi:hypothetical protein
MNSSPWKIVNCDAIVDNSGRVSSISPDGPIKGGMSLKYDVYTKIFAEICLMFDVWSYLRISQLKMVRMETIYVCVYIYIHISVQRFLKAGFTQICFNIMAKNHFQHQVKRISLYGGSD